MINFYHEYLLKRKDGASIMGMIHMDMLCVMWIEMLISRVP